MQRLNDLLYWMEERERIRKAKEKGLPKPWTDDWVFKETYFCNVHREDDKVTKWIRDNWRMWGSERNHCIAMAVARFVNKPETLGVLGYPMKGFDLPYCHMFTERMNQGGWGNAYLVSTGGKSMPKGAYVANVLSTLDRASGTLDFSTLQSTYRQLTLIDGIGSFMAGQIIADLKNTPGHQLQQAPDWMTWCSHGPGSLRGMAWLLGIDKCTPTKFYVHMEPLLGLLWNEDWEIHAQDAQNCLCEFDKFMRVMKGTGKSKRKYNGS